MSKFRCGFSKNWWNLRYEVKS